MSCHITLYTTCALCRCQPEYWDCFVAPQVATLTAAGAQFLCDKRTLFVSFSSGFRRDRDPEKEETAGAEGTTVEPDCLRWPHSVQWLDLGQSLVFADLFGQYRTLLWTVCSKALWLQLHVPHAGNAAGSINLQDNHRRFQILHRIRQASKTGKLSGQVNSVERVYMSYNTLTYNCNSCYLFIHLFICFFVVVVDLVLKECRTMMEDFSLYLLAITAHAEWDYGTHTHKQTTLSKNVGWATDQLD